jgi:hypothetical protein
LTTYGQNNNSNEKDLKLIKYEIEKSTQQKIDSISAKYQRELQTEIKEYRKYMAELDKRFYDRLTIIASILSGLLSIITFGFLWYYGQSRKEAYEFEKIKNSIQNASSVDDLKIKLSIPFLNLLDINISSEKRVADLLKNIYK